MTVQRLREELSRWLVVTLELDVKTRLGVLLRAGEKHRVQVSMRWPLLLSFRTAAGTLIYPSEVCNVEIAQ